MSMTIGKEARAELETVATSSPDPWARKAVQHLLDRCTDAPEVGLPDGFPWSQRVRSGIESMCRDFADASSRRGDHEADAALLSLARWLDSAGQKESEDE